MKLQEGPAFGALIIGVGVGYLVWQKTGNAFFGVVSGFALAVADYALLVWFSKFKQK